jgi:hypothetical protein
MKTKIHRKTAKLTTELVCPCGARFKVTVKKKGWLLSLWRVGLTKRWVIELDKLVDGIFKPEIPAKCPKCLGAPACQCRDC